MQMRADIEIGVKTDVGMVREENQDGYLVYEPTDPALFALIGRIAVVADGMGGMAGGRTANRLALRAFLAALLTGATETPEADDPTRLQAAIRAANEAVFAAARANPALKGMGTTMTAVQVKGNMLTFAHVGDTRLLLVRDQKIALKTKDHVEGPKSSALTRSVGVFATLEVDTGSFELREGDRLLMCSDGLWDLVPPAETKQLLTSNPPATAAAALVKAANAQGGHDNVTALVVHVSRLGPASAANPGPIELGEPSERPTMPLPGKEDAPYHPDRRWLLVAGAGLLFAIVGTILLL